MTVLSTTTTTTTTVNTLSERDAFTIACVMLNSISDDHVRFHALEAKSGKGFNSNFADRQRTAESAMSKGHALKAIHPDQYDRYHAVHPFPTQWGKCSETCVHRALAAHR